MKFIVRFGHLFLLAAGLAILNGCGKSKVDQALESDANGYQCVGCKTKFYTDRKVFPNVCPQCKQGNIAPVVGFVCSADQHVTIAPRGPGFYACKQCGKMTSALMIPGEGELKAWGASKKTKAEVSGN
jgi:DNA-directed RNA polymerase subunit RPC12/RpoP